MPAGTKKNPGGTLGCDSTGSENSSKERYEFDADRGLAVQFVDGLGDLRAAVSMSRIWITLGWLDFRRETRRTVLGPLWSIFGTAVTVAVLGYVYGAVFDFKKAPAFPYIAGGLVLWFFIAGCIQGGLTVYQGARGVLTERNLPIALSAFRFVFRYFVELLVKFAVFAMAAIYVALPMNENAFLAIPGLAILVACGFSVVLLLGPLGARFRDLNQIVSPLMLIAFLASPVLWPQGMLGNNVMIALVNPFTHFLAIVRDPLMGSPPPTLSLVISLAITALCWCMAVVTHCLTKDRVVYWI